mgnify:CR=1 FL=1
MRNRAIPFSPPDITELEINEAADALSMFVNFLL